MWKGKRVETALQRDTPVKGHTVDTQEASDGEEILFPFQVNSN